jgi:hypothetical protein
MARPLRITYDSAVHNVTVRYNDRRNMLYTDGNRKLFIDRLAETFRLYENRFIFSPS